jgi:hypothetical protein
MDRLRQSAQGRGYGPARPAGPRGQPADRRQRVSGMTRKSIGEFAGLEGYEPSTCLSVSQTIRIWLPRQSLRSDRRPLCFGGV